MKNKMNSCNVIVIGAALLGLALAAPFASGSPGEYVRGEIIGGFSLLEHINLVPGDKTLVGLGMKDGVIKGDVLQFAAKSDTGLIDPTGRCAVLRVSPNNSVCEVIRAKREIERSSTVFTDLLRWDQVQFYPSIYRLLYAIVEPYEPPRKVNVYLGGVFNEKNEITAFSMEMQNQVAYIFGQKKKINLRNDLAEKDFLFYPDAPKDHRDSLKELMRQAGLDVFVTGSYAVRSGYVDFIFHKFDAKYGNEELRLRIPLEQIDPMALADVIRPYKPVRKKEITLCEVSYRPLNYPVTRDMREQAILQEARGNQFTQLNLRKTGFNIIGATSLKLKVGENILDFDGERQKEVMLLEGMNRLTATFKRAYYRNESLLFTSDRTESKEIIVYAHSGGKLNIDITADPALGGKPTFKVYRKLDKDLFLLKSVQVESGEKGIDLYKD